MVILTQTEISKNSIASALIFKTANLHNKYLGGKFKMIIPSEKHEGLPATSYKARVYLKLLL